MREWAARRIYNLYICFKMKKLVEYFFLFLPLLLNAQIKTDTLFSGKKLYVDLSESKINDFNQLISQKDICLYVEKIDPRYKHLKLQEEGYTKAHIPYVLRSYSEKTKSTVLLNYDALIFSSYSGSDEFMNEIYLLEFFFETEDKAQSCEKTINDLIRLRKKQEKKDKEILLGTYNWFCLSKINRVYLIHYMHDETLDCPIVKNFSDKLIQILNTK